MNYVFDIDGTICTLSDGKYENAQPIQTRINKINNLYDKGHYIIFYTARGMGRYNNNLYLAHENFYDFTFNQLNNWGVKFHKLILGKPSGDIYIDDKGIKDVDFFEN